MKDFVLLIYIHIVMFNNTRNHGDDAEFDLTPKVKSLLGSIKVPVDFDYKADLTDQFSKKHLNV